MAEKEAGQNVGGYMQGSKTMEGFDQNCNGIKAAEAMENGEGDDDSDGWEKHGVHDFNKLLERSEALTGNATQRIVQGTWRTEKKGMELLEHIPESVMKVLIRG